MLLASDLSNITPSRSFNLAYLILDSIFILVLCVLLFVDKKRLTLLWALAGGILYYIVDYGIFYLALNTRVITVNGETCDSLMTGLILLWMSLSYGITNFAFIWLALRKDNHLLQYSLLIFGWWLVAPTLSQIGGGGVSITTFRESHYHWVMALILVIGYGALIIYSLFTKKKLFNLLLLNLIGISIQFGWEFALLINGIRPMNESSLMTLVIDSLIETNLGMPYIYGLFVLINRHFSEDGKKLSKPEENQITDR